MHSLFNKILKPLDIQINGGQPWDIQVKDCRFYFSLLFGSIGVGQAFVKGWWTCHDLEGFFLRLFTFFKKHSWVMMFNTSNVYDSIKRRFCNLQRKRRNQKAISHHYDLSNQFFEVMLGRTMSYTCAVWNNTDQLDDAQKNKLEMICQKLNLKSSDKVLDIGCGWGSFAKYAAQNYGCEVTGITISQKQKNYAENFCKGLPVKIILQDYRDHVGQYDKVVSIEMIEAVGRKNYHAFFKQVATCLKSNGRFLMQVISTDDLKYCTDAWTTKYIFPDGEIPYFPHLTKNSESFFKIEQNEDIGLDYIYTLRAWHKNFLKNWNQFKGQSFYNNEFKRMWSFYLNSFPALFHLSLLKDLQILYCKI